MIAENKLVCTVLVPQIISIISKYYGISPNDAMQLFYESNTETSLADETTGLFGQSPLYVASLFIQEKDGIDNVDMSKL